MSKKTRTRDAAPHDPDAERREIATKGADELAGRLEAYLAIANNVSAGEGLPAGTLGDLARLVSATALNRIARSLEVIAARE